MIYIYEIKILRKMPTAGYKAAMSAINYEVFLANEPKSAMFRVEGNLLTTLVQSIIANFEKVRTRKKGFATSFKTITHKYNDNQTKVTFDFHCEENPFCEILVSKI